MNKRLLWVLPFFLLAFAVPVSADLESGIETYYSFDDDDLTGSNPDDLTPNGNDGNNSGATTGVTGKINQAFSFDGTNDFVSMPNQASVTAGEDYTFYAWFDLDSLASSGAVFGWTNRASTSSATYFTFEYNQPDGQLRFSAQENAPTNARSINYSWSQLNGYHLFVGVYNASSDTLRLYINDTLVGSAAGVDIPTASNMVFYVGQLPWSSANVNPWNGKIDEFGFHRGYAYSFQDVSNLFAGGAGNQYPYNPTESFSKVRVSDLYDNATLSALSVTWTAQGVTNTTDGSGVATCNNCSGDLSFVVDGGSLYFNASGTGVQNATTSVSVFGAFYDVRAFDLLNDGVSVFNVSSGSQFNSTSSGLTKLYLKPNTSNTVVVNGSGFVSQSFSVSTSGRDLGSFNASGLYEGVLSFNATDSLSGSPVTTFSVNGNYLNDSYSFEGNTTNGSLSFPLMFGDYETTIDATGFAIQTVNVTFENVSQNYEFFLLPQNSIFLYFYEESTLASLNGTNVTVEFFSPDNTSFTNSSTSGEMIVEDLDVGTWTIEASASGYTTRDYFVTISSRSSQLLDVYLANSSLTEVTTFAVRSKVTSDILVGATFTINHKVGSSWVVLDQCITDAFGDCRFDLIDGVEYQFVVEADGFDTKTGTFVRTLSGYTISLSAEGEAFSTYLDDFSYSATPLGSSLDSANVTFGLSVSSPDGRIEYFSQELFTPVGNFSNNVTTSTSGGSISRSVDLSGVSGEVLAVYTIKSTSFSDPFVFSNSYYVFDSTPTNNLTFASFMDYYGSGGVGELSFATRGLLVTTAAVLLSTPLGLLFGGGAAVFGAVFVYGVAGLFGWLNWGIVVVISTLLVGLAVIGRRGGF